MQKCCQVRSGVLFQIVSLAQHKKRLTQRAADGGYAPRFLSVFVALGLSRFDGKSTLPPTAANARRWAECLAARQQRKGSECL